jgi:predicted Zn-dependent protease
MSRLDNDRLESRGAVEEQLEPVHARLLADVDRANDAVDRANAKLAEALRILGAYEEAIAQYRSETRDAAVEPQVAPEADGVPG